MKKSILYLSIVTLLIVTLGSCDGLNVSPGSADTTTTNENKDNYNSTSPVFVSTSGTSNGNPVGTVEVSFPKDIVAIDKTKFTVKQGSTNPPSTAATVSQAFFVGNKVYLTIDKSIALGDLVSVEFVDDAVTFEGGETSTATSNAMISNAAVVKAPELIAVFPISSPTVKLGFVFDKVLTSNGLAIGNFKIARGSATPAPLTEGTITLDTGTVSPSSTVRKIVSPSSGVINDDFYNYIVDASSPFALALGETLTVELAAGAAEDTAGHLSVASTTPLTMTYTDEVEPQYVGIYVNVGKTFTLLFDEPIKNDSSLDISQLAVKINGTQAIDLPTNGRIFSTPHLITRNGVSGYPVIVITSNNNTDVTNRILYNYSLSVEYGASAFTGIHSNLPAKATTSAKNTTASANGSATGPKIVDIIRMGTSNNSVILVFDSILTNTIASGNNFTYVLNKNGGTVVTNAVRGHSAVLSTDVDDVYKYISTTLSIHYFVPGEVLKITTPIINTVFGYPYNLTNAVDTTGITVIIP